MTCDIYISEIYTLKKSYNIRKHFLKGEFKHFIKATSAFSSLFLIYPNLIEGGFTHRLTSIIT